jgi:MoxR-like ATPase
MILILFRIFANIPVILMGETGCGKTELIKQLMKMLNKDKENKSNNFIIKNMHSGVKEDEIIKVIEKAEENLEKSKNDMVCIFFDEINTTSLLSKMKEIFVNHSLNGKKNR